jgi:hypothetical protein
MKELRSLIFIRITVFYSVKDTVNRMKGQATDWKIIFEKNITDGGLLKI